MTNDFKRMWTKEEIENIAKEQAPTIEGYVTEEQFEELVKVTPTDVNIVEDQGVWQIQLKHDSEVLSITDMTPFTRWVEDTIDAKISTTLQGDY